MPQKIKMVELKGSRWQITKANALDGSNLIRRFIKAGGVDVETFLRDMSDDTFKAVQNITLKNVYEIQVIDGKEVPLPVMLPSGIIGGKAAEDTSLIFILTFMSLMWSLEDFFAGNASKEYQQMMETSIA